MQKSRNVVKLISQHLFLLQNLFHFIDRENSLRQPMLKPRQLQL